MSEDGIPRWEVKYLLLPFEFGIVKLKTRLLRCEIWMAQISFPKESSTTTHPSVCPLQIIFQPDWIYSHLQAIKCCVIVWCTEKYLTALKHRVAVRLSDGFAFDQRLKKPSRFFFSKFVEDRNPGGDWKSAGEFFLNRLARHTQMPMILSEIIHVKNRPTSMPD